MNDYSKSKLREIEKKFDTGKNDEGGREGRSEGQL